MNGSQFKMIAQKAPNGNVILVAVVDTEFFGLGEELPNIFEVTCFKPIPNIYTGTAPIIKPIMSTVKERADLNGMGVSGILTSEKWFYTAPRNKSPFQHMIELDNKEL